MKEDAFYEAILLFKLIVATSLCNVPVRTKYDNLIGEG
jgi:hypothetical protein